jgi:hypothetical protein
MIAQALPRHKHLLKSNPSGRIGLCGDSRRNFPRRLLMGRGCGSNQLGLDTKPRGKSVNDLYEKYAVQVSPQLASDRVLGRRKEQCNPNFSGAHVLRTTL